MMERGPDRPPATRRASSRLASIRLDAGAASGGSAGAELSAMDAPRRGRAKPVSVAKSTDRTLTESLPQTGPASCQRGTPHRGIPSDLGADRQGAVEPFWIDRVGSNEASRKDLLERVEQSFDGGESCAASTPMRRRGSSIAGSVTLWRPVTWASTLSGAAGWSGPSEGRLGEPEHHRQRMTLGRGTRGPVRLHPADDRSAQRRAARGAAPAARGSPRRAAGRSASARTVASRS